MNTSSIFLNSDILETIVYHNQDMNIDKNPPNIFIIPQFYLYLCVYVLNSIILYQDSEQFHDPKDAMFFL